MLQYPLHKTKHFEKSMVYTERKLFNEVPNVRKTFKSEVLFQITKNVSNEKAYFYQIDKCLCK